jgi:hypothetical protein
MLEIRLISVIGWTYTAAKLKSLLNRIVGKLDVTMGKAEYVDIKPVDIVVLTDGTPSLYIVCPCMVLIPTFPPADDPVIVIADTIERLDGQKHHLNAVGIQFVQIGDEDGAEAALQLLKNCPLRVSDYCPLFSFLHQENPDFTY